MVIYDIREVLRTSVEKKLKADITEDEKKPKETTQKEWVKGYKKWKEEK